jgi:ankyrin repeat protein
MTEEEIQIQRKPKKPELGRSKSNTKPEISKLTEKDWQEAKEKLEELNECSIIYMPFKSGKPVQRDYRPYIFPSGDSVTKEALKKIKNKCPYSKHSLKKFPARPNKIIREIAGIVVEPQSKNENKIIKNKEKIEKIFEIIINYLYLRYPVVCINGETCESLHQPNMFLNKKLQEIIEKIFLQTKAGRQCVLEYLLKEKDIQQIADKLAKLCKAHEGKGFIDLLRGIKVKIKQDQFNTILLQLFSSVSDFLAQENSKLAKQWLHNLKSVLTNQNKDISDATKKQLNHEILKIYQKFAGEISKVKKVHKILEWMESYKLNYAHLLNLITPHLIKHNDKYFFIALILCYVDSGKNLKSIDFNNYAKAYLYEWLIKELKFINDSLDATRLKEILKLLTKHVYELQKFAKSKDAQDRVTKLFEESFEKIKNINIQINDRLSQMLVILTAEELIKTNKNDILFWLLYQHKNAQKYFMQRLTYFINYADKNNNDKMKELLLIIKAIKNGLHKDTIVDLIINFYKSSKTAVSIQALVCLLHFIEDIDGHYNLKNYLKEIYKSLYQKMGNICQQQSYMLTESDEQKQTAEQLLFCKVFNEVCDDNPSTFRKCMGHGLSIDIFKKYLNTANNIMQRKFVSNEITGIFNSIENIKNPKQKLVKINKLVNELVEGYYCGGKEYLLRSLEIAKTELNEASREQLFEKILPNIAVKLSKSNTETDKKIMDILLDGILHESDIFKRPLKVNASISKWQLFKKRMTAFFTGKKTKRKIYAKWQKNLSKGRHKTLLQVVLKNSANETISQHDRCSMLTKKIIDKVKKNNLAKNKYINYKKNWLAKSALWYAARHGSFDAVKYLLQQPGIDINGGNFLYSGELGAIFGATTPLDIAFNYENEHVLDLLQIINNLKNDLRLPWYKKLFKKKDIKLSERTKKSFMDISEGCYSLYIFRTILETAKIMFSKNGNIIEKIKSDMYTNPIFLRKLVLTSLYNYQLWKAPVYLKLLTEIFEKLYEEQPGSTVIKKSNDNKIIFRKIIGFKDIQHISLYLFCLIRLFNYNDFAFRLLSKDFKHLGKMNLGKKICYNILANEAKTINYESFDSIEKIEECFTNKSEKVVSFVLKALNKKINILELDSASVLSVMAYFAKLGIINSVKKILGLQEIKAIKSELLYVGMVIGAISGKENVVDALCTHTHKNKITIHQLFQQKKNKHLVWSVYGQCDKTVLEQEFTLFRELAKKVDEDYLKICQSLLSEYIKDCFVKSSHNNDNSESKQFHIGEKSNLQLLKFLLKKAGNTKDNVELTKLLKDLLEFAKSVEKDEYGNFSLISILSKDGIKVSNDSNTMFVTESNFFSPDSNLNKKENLPKNQKVNDLRKGCGSAVM